MAKEHWLKRFTFDKVWARCRWRTITACGTRDGQVAIDIILAEGPAPVGFRTARTLVTPDQALALSRQLEAAARGHSGPSLHATLDALAPPAGAANRCHEGGGS